METTTMLDQLIEAVNVELLAGNWAQVIELTAALYAAASDAGDVAFAELVQDLHWIANDALAHPLEVGVLIAP